MAVYDPSSGTVTTAVAALLVNSTANASTSLYVGKWIYHDPNREQRRVTVYAPTTGTVTVAPAWTAPAPPDQVEMTSLFPSNNEIGSDDDYRTLINRALRRLLVPDRVALSITTGEEYATTTWPWLDRPDRLVRVLEPPPVGTRAIDSSWRGWSLTLDAQTPVLEVDVPFLTATGSITLEVLRPANTWIKTGATWAETPVSSGLLNDTDEAIPGIEDVLPVALMEAYRALVNRSPGRPNGNWSKLFADARTEARKTRYYDITSERQDEPVAETAA